MAIDKSLISGNTDMLILKLLEKQDMLRSNPTILLN